MRTKKYKEHDLTFAGILPLFAAGTEEARMEDEVGSQSRVLQLPLAVKMCQNRQINLLILKKSLARCQVILKKVINLEDVLVRSTLAESILAPSTDPAPLSGKVLDTGMSRKMFYLSS